GLSFFGARVTVGTPDEVTEEILRYKANTRITHMVLMELPGIAAEKNNRNLELFAKEVMPHIRKRCEAEHEDSLLDASIHPAGSPRGAEEAQERHAEASR